ncbi:peripheral-type benzodiazepine receptor [Mycobacteroides abscessus subsp. massiliense]|nr:peripheral-type benzodiazepine receptor [Mycobacteroides abscessus subsp. massiliense]
MVTIALFWVRSRVAAVLLLPYLVWTTFAACLNFAVWQLNTAAV